MRTWIQTLSGRALEPLALTPDMVGGIGEIAHALAGKYRFTGQTLLRYSVAEHCVRGARLMPRAYAGAFLLHELSEVYLPDIASPLKPHTFVVLDPHGTGVPMAWADLEREHARVILRALGHASIEPLVYSPEVKLMDLALLATEKRDLMSPEPESWGLPVPPLELERITPWSPASACAAFLALYEDLFAAPL